MNCNFCGNNTWLIIILILLFCGGWAFFRGGLIPVENLGGGGCVCRRGGGISPGPAGCWGAA